MYYQVSIRAEKLPRGGWGKVPDPYAVVTISGGRRESEVLGTSEPVQKTTQPAFAKTFFLETDAGTNMQLTVEIFNKKNGRKLAAATFEATEVHRSPGSMTVAKTATGARCVSPMLDDVHRWITHSSAFSLFLVLPVVVTCRIAASVRTSVRGNAAGTVSLHIRGLDMKNVVRSSHRLLPCCLGLPLSISHT